MLRPLTLITIVVFASPALLAEEHGIPLPATLPVTQPTQAASVDDARMLFNQGDFRGALQKISIAMPLALPDRDQGLGRYKLLMLRGECLLRLKERSLAIDAYNAASRSTNDINKTAVALGTSLLIKASPSFIYLPPGALPTDGVDIIDSTSRLKALSLMYDQVRGDLQKQVTLALDDKTLTPMQKLLPAIQELYSIEMAATGRVEQTKLLANQLGDHARKLIGKELVRLNARIDDLQNLASTPSYIDNNGFAARGLYSPEQNELKDDIVYLDKIKAVTERARRISKILDQPTDAWESLGDATDDAANACAVGTRSHVDLAALFHHRIQKTIVRLGRAFKQL